MAVTNRPQVKLVCSFGGKLQPSPIGNKLIYCGGETRLILVDRDIQFDELHEKLSSEFRVGNDGGGVCVGMKYQLPGEDPNVLVSLTNGDDLENMMFEYDRIHRSFSGVKAVRIRIFLDAEKTPSKAEFGSGSGSGSANLNPDYLFGFDKEEDYRNVCDEKALEEWKIPRDEHAPKPKSEDQGHVPEQPQNCDDHVTYAGAGLEPSMFYYPPVNGYYPPANGWGMAPAYIIVTPPPVTPTVVPRYCVL